MIVRRGNSRRVHIVGEDAKSQLRIPIQKPPAALAGSKTGFPKRRIGDRLLEQTDHLGAPGRAGPALQRLFAGATELLQRSVHGPGSPFRFR